MMGWKTKTSFEPPYVRSDEWLRDMEKDGIPRRAFDLRLAAVKRIGRSWWENLWIWRRN